MVKDPVCGMQIEEHEAAGSSVYNKKTYYFCAPSCKKAFDREPEKYFEELHHHSPVHQASHQQKE